MKRLLLMVAFVALALAPGASAHPLGNFTINRYSELTLSGDRVYVHYVLDLAEIPTYQEGGRVRRRAFAAEVARRLVLRIDGRRVSLTPRARAVRAKPGAAGLDTLRYEAVYTTPRVRGSRLTYRDENFVTRRGWREVVVVARDGARISSSTAPAVSSSRALTQYPRDLLTEPLAVASATVSYRAGTHAGPLPAIGARSAEHASSRFEQLVDGDLTPGFVLLSLLLALFWGAAHALSPGHGKAIVAGYLVGSRGKARHALALGLIVTATHTVGVFALGLVTLGLSELFVPDQLYPWLNLVSALLVLGVGLGILRARVRHAQHHRHGHDHDHEVRGLVGIGISAGIVPCPTALVVLLAAISLHRVGYGLVLILAFSAGLAASVSAIGVLAVTARRAFGRVTLEGSLVRALPAVSTFVVIGLGVVMTARALPQL